jgi:septal ring factor EnvC (AmiA/AmiB activator)
MNRLLLVAFFVPAATAVAQAPSPEQQRHEDLARIQARIGALEKRLEESQKNVATAEEQLKRLDWRLELATEQNRALAASREELSQRLVTLSAERGAAAAAVEKSRRTLVARARVLHRFGRFGYFRILLEARDVNALLSSVDRLDALARRDGDLLARDRAARERLSADLAREQSVKKEIDQLYARSRRESVRIAALKQERERFLDRQRRFAVSGREEVVSLTDKAARLERLLEALSRGESEEPASPSGSIRPWKGCSTGRLAARSSRPTGGTGTRSSTPGRSPTGSRFRCPKGRPSARCTPARRSTPGGWRSTETS